MANSHYSRREEVVDLVEEIVSDLVDITEKLEHLRTLTTEYSRSYSSEDFDDE
jgi:hypothetical protein